MSIALISPADEVIIPVDWDGLPDGVLLVSVEHVVPSPLTKLSESMDPQTNASQVKIKDAVHGGMYLINAQAVLSNTEKINRQVTVRCLYGIG